MSAEPTSHALGITSSMVNRRFATRHQLGGLGWCGVTADRPWLDRLSAAHRQIGAIVFSSIAACDRLTGRENGHRPVACRVL